jgi:hypothetical protein
MGKKSEEVPPLAEWTDEDVESGTHVGGWWAPEQPAEPDASGLEGAPAPDTSGPEAAPAPDTSGPTATVELVPSDGAVRVCEVVRLGSAGALLRLGAGPVPSVGQMLVLELDDDRVALDGEVERADPEGRRFEARFVNLDANRRSYLAGKATGGDLDDADTSYVEVKRRR